MFNIAYKQIILIMLASLLIFTKMAISSDKNSTVPDKFELGQNYPNPFNPSTSINYRLPWRAFVVLKIYNILGQDIRTLVNAPNAKGLHTVKWNGTDERGFPVASGVYFYRLAAGDFSQIRRMVLLR
ncbi:MAG: T9SS type A sorting domain-containing protein [Calditrichia bacterium]